MNDKLKKAYKIMKDIKDMVQTYTNAMSFSGRQKLREIDCKDIKDYVIPRQEEILPILEEALDLVKDKAEKEKVQRCIELNKTIKDHLNQLVKDDFDMEQISSEVITLFGYIARLVNSHE